MTFSFWGTHPKLTKKKKRLPRPVSPGPQNQEWSHPTGKLELGLHADGRSGIRSVRA